MTISKEAISKAKPGTALHDKQIVGLGLYFGSRSASWKYCYRVRGTGKQRRPKIGNYPELSIRDAREIVREYAVAIARGEDPFIKREVKTLEYVYEKFVIAYTGKLKPGTLRTYQNQWEVHIPQSIKRSDIRDIKRATLAELHRGIGGHTSNRVLALISRLYSFAQQSDYCGSEFNPARGIERAKEKPRERVATRDELHRIGNGITNWLSADNRRERQFAYLLKILILTGCRISEWTTAELSWIDFETNSLHLPDSKTGAKVIPLSDEVMSIINVNRNNKYVFDNGFNEQDFKHYRHFWDLFKGQCKLKDLRIHDLRRSFASYALNEGMSIHDISKLLGHSNVMVTDKVYAKLNSTQKMAKAGKAASIMMDQLAQPKPTSQLSPAQHKADTTH